MLQGSSVIPLNKVAADESKDLILESTTECATKKIIVRKEGEKDLWIEVWSNKLNGGLVQSCKISGECTKVYADAVFGTVTWSKDLTKIAFVGEVPAPASYKNPWDLPEKKDEKKGDDEKEEQKEEHWQEDKFLYDEEFGELLVGKKTAGLFVYDLETNKIQKVVGLPEKTSPQYPVFDENSTGLVFSAVHQPLKKLGLIYCLNRPNHLYYIKSPAFKKEDIGEDYLQDLG